MRHIGKCTLYTMVCSNCDILGLKHYGFNKQEMKTNLILIYLACEQIVSGIKQSSPKKEVGYTTY